MNIGSVSCSCGAREASRQSPFKTIKEDFKTLEKALKSGDLKAAQDAFAKLKQDLPAPQNSGGSTGPGAGMGTPAQASTDLDAVGAALQSGDLSGAQKAFATFVQDLQSARQTHGHHRHHHDNDGDADEGSTTSTAPATATTNGGLNVQA